MQQHFGVGGIIAVALWAEPADARQFSASRQGSPLLRWALFEAAEWRRPARLIWHATAAPDEVLAWSRWRRRHQARARCHHDARGASPEVRL